jgi:hypothetical protein
MFVDREVRHKSFYTGIEMLPEPGAYPGFQAAAHGGAVLGNEKVAACRAWLNRSCCVCEVRLHGRSILLRDTLCGFTISSLEQGADKNLRERVDFLAKRVPGHVSCSNYGIGRRIFRCSASKKKGMTLHE